MYANLIVSIAEIKSDLKRHDAPLANFCQKTTAGLLALMVFFQLVNNK